MPQLVARALEGWLVGWVGVDAAVLDESCKIIGSYPNVLPDLVERDSPLLNESADEPNSRAEFSGNVLDGQQSGHGDLLGQWAAPQVHRGPHQNRHHDRRAERVRRTARGEPRH